MTTKKTTTKKASAPSTQDFWTEGFEKAKDQWTQALSGAPELPEFHKDNLDALVASATAASDGIEKITNEAMAFQQKSFENGVAIANQTMGTTSVQEVLEIQGAYAKTAFEAYASHMGKLGELWGEGARASLAPLSGRFGNLFEGLRS